MNMNLKQLPSQIITQLQKVRRYRVVIFVVLIVGLYGYLVFQINAAANPQPSSSTELITAKSTPKVDPAVVQQLTQLQDNSVSVKALFNEARTNPFQ